MITIQYKDDIRSYESGTSWKTIADDYASYFDSPILLVRDLEGGGVLDLRDTADVSTTVEFLTFKDKEGRLAYTRTAIFLLLRAFYEMYGSEEGTNKILVDYTMGGNYYVQPTGAVPASDDMAAAIRERMRKYVDEKAPIERESVSLNEAIRHFEKFHMQDKAALFRYRRISMVTLYRMGIFRDYFYGPMCLDASYVPVFDVRCFRDGLILILPEKRRPSELRMFEPSIKYFEVQKETTRWAETLGLKCLSEFNDLICADKANDLILMQEAYYEKKIAEIVQGIIRKERKFVFVAGPSASGKTSTAYRLAIQLRAYGIEPRIISADNYFIDVDKREKGPDGKVDFESVSAVDVELFNDDMLRLLNGETVEFPHYNFMTQKREYKGDHYTLGPKSILVVEGIHCLNRVFSSRIPEDKKYGIYVSALTQLNIDYHNRIPTADVRLLRRIVRDHRTRGYSAKDTIDRWPSVRAGEEVNIFPYQDNADVVFNSAMIYELAVLKIYAEPLLFSIKKTDPEYSEASRLLKFLDFVLPVSPEIIPGTSIIREFIGGSYLNVG